MCMAAGAEFDQRLDRARDVEGAAEAGVGVDQQRQLADVGDAPHVGEHVVQRADAEIGQTQRAGCDAAARQIDGAIAAALARAAHGRR